MITKYGLGSITFYEDYVFLVCQDGAKAYMRNHNVPMDMQRRVQRWYDYAWSRNRMNGGGDINSLGLLPDKLKTELALHVNLETLKKVKKKG